MPRLVVAEKPSVARDLARVLGVSQRRNGFYQGKGWLITWCIGHLVELCEPHEYNSAWKRWSLPTLPMIPQQGFRLRPIQRTQSQYNIVSRLLTRNDVSEVVNACDAGREGELIFRYVYYLSGSNKPTRRLWISSMTDDAISEGFDNLRPGASMDPLWDAARCRSEADWLVGLNATRAMTLRTRQLLGPGADAPLLSVGRVQTPCLAMLVQRELTIRNFVPQDYWQIQGAFLAEVGDYQGRWFRLIEDPEAEGKEKTRRYDRFDELEEAQAVMERLQGMDGVVEQVETKEVTERPPLLFDLTRLQRTANKRFGFSAARTLELAQALYEKHKLLTYPRTDSAYLSQDLYPKMRSTIEAVCTGDFAPFAQYILELQQIPRSRRMFNDAKVSDHHAIIPTELTPQLNRLNSDELRLYDLVVRRFLAGFFPNAIFEKTTVITSIDGETFLTRGRVVVDRGWREVVGLPDHAQPKKSRDGQEEDDETHGILPPLQEGDVVSVQELELQAKKTRPPSRYNEATLLAAMEGAGRLLDEEELQQAMKDSGLGTPATRANIIETLLRRGFVERRGKTMIPTERGIQLIESIPVDSLKSPELTGMWEARMSRIARGEDDAFEFQSEVCAYLEETIDAIKNASLSGLAHAVLNAPDDPGSGGGPGGGPGGGRSSAKGGKGGQKTTKARSKSTSKSKKSSKSSKSRTTAKSSTKSATKSTKSTTKSSRSTAKSATKTSRSAAKAPTKSTKAAAKTTKSSKSTTKSSSTRPKAPTKSTQAAAKKSSPKAPAKTSAPKAKAKARERAPEASTAPLQAPQPSNREDRQASSQLQGSLGFCPRCRKGLIIWGKRAWGCDQWRAGCQTTVPFAIDGYQLSVKDALALLQGNHVGPIPYLQDDDGQQYTGVLSFQNSSDHGFVKIKRQK